jgi:hypothetical protein
MAPKGREGAQMLHKGKRPSPDPRGASVLWNMTDYILFTKHNISNMFRDEQLSRSLQKNGQ